MSAEPLNLLRKEFVKWSEAGPALNLRDYSAICQINHLSLYQGLSQKYNILVGKEILARSIILTQGKFCYESRAYIYIVGLQRKTELW